MTEPRHCAPSFPTFEDGYRAACLVDAILDSHRPRRCLDDAVGHTADAEIASQA